MISEAGDEIASAYAIRKPWTVPALGDPLRAPVAGVLIVEDEYLIAQDLKLMLEYCGWKVIGPAENVRRALTLLEEQRPSVAVLDINLGRELVTPVAELLKAMRVPFALASAYENPAQFGAVLYEAPNVGKPTGERRLLAALEQLTRRL